MENTHNQPGYKENLALRLSELRKDFTNGDLYRFCMSVCPIELCDNIGQYDRWFSEIWLEYVKRTK